MCATTAPLQCEEDADATCNADMIPPSRQPQACMSRSCLTSARDSTWAHELSASSITCVLPALFSTSPSQLLFSLSSAILCCVDAASVFCRLAHLPLIAKLLHALPATAHANSGHAPPTAAPHHASVKQQCAPHAAVSEVQAFFTALVQDKVFVGPVPAPITWAAFKGHALNTYCAAAYRP